MKTSVIQRSWIEGYGYRLDTSPYLGGALEAKVLLDKLPIRKDKLHTLTAGFEGGIYNGPHFSRTFVESPEYGVPFVGGSSMLHADLSDLPLLSKKQTLSPKLAHLELKPGMSLISCSGTIGKMVYARREMVGMWSSQHIMKVVADPSKIPSGYLYAYLCSKFGIPLITSGTYGAIIQSINPEHLWDLPVPRLGDALEHEIHELVEEAAELRSEASKLKQTAIAEFHSAIHWTLPAKQIARTVKSIGISRRFDAHFHSSTSNSGRKLLQTYDRTETVRTFAAAIYCPGRGARTKVDNADYGVPFLSSSDVFEVAPTAAFLISRDTRDFESFILSAEDVLLPRSGSIGGVIGRAVLPFPANYGQAGSDHLIHIRCRTKEDAYYLWAVLASKPGYAAVVATAFGSAIPSLDMELIGNLLIPIIEGGQKASIVEKISESLEKGNRATSLENKARELLELTIKEHTS